MNLLTKVTNNLQNNLININPIEIVFIVLLVLFALSDVKVPYYLSPLINKPFIYASLLMGSVVLYVYKKPLFALLLLIFSLILINRSKQSSHNLIIPTQENKNKSLENLNTHLNEKTLEEEIVQYIRKPNNIPSTENYHPVLCDIHNAKDL